MRFRHASRDSTRDEEGSRRSQAADEHRLSRAPGGTGPGEGNTSELGRRSLEEGEAGLEGILALGVPGLEEGGQI